MSITTLGLAALVCGRNSYWILYDFTAPVVAEWSRLKRVTYDVHKYIWRLDIQYLQQSPDERAALTQAYTQDLSAFAAQIVDELYTHQDLAARAGAQAFLQEDLSRYRPKDMPKDMPKDLRCFAAVMQAMLRQIPNERVAQIQAFLQENLSAKAGRIAQEFYAHRCATYVGEHFIEQTDENRKVFLPLVQGYFENPENVEHIQRLDIDHFARAIFGRILRSPSVRTEYENFLKDQIINLSVRKKAFLIIPLSIRILDWLCPFFATRFYDDERAEQIAQEFYNYRCEAFAGAHFVEQTDENRENVIARVKRYFRNSKNWEHIQNLDTEHFAKEVLGERNIPRLPAVRAEYENFLRDQIIKLPEIEALKYPKTAWQRYKADSGGKMLEPFGKISKEALTRWNWMCIFTIVAVCVEIFLSAMEALSPAPAERERLEVAG